MMSDQYSREPFGATEDSRGMVDQVRSLHGWSILIGAFVGLVVGLIIGWVVWPVQWTDAWPADLSEEAKAQYLASVAQVYAYYPDARAEEIARMRLYDLNDNLGEEIAAAQAYFDENPQRDSNVYITMLAEMATGLGVSSDAIVSPETGAAPGGDEEAAAVDAAGPSWLRWLFTLLLVVLLIGGGVYIIRRLAQRRPTEPGEYGYDEPESPQGPYAQPQPAVPASTGRGSTTGFERPRADDYRFDQEPDENIPYSTGAAVITADQFEDDTYFDEASAAGLSHGPAEEEGELAPSAEEEVPPAITPATEQFEEAPEEPAKSAAGRVLSTYIVHYQAGIPEFEQSHNIVDPETSRYIGECGMGVNMKNGILQDVPENVIALDVWLFDQKRDRSLGNQTRVLLSEYAIDHDLEQAFIRERPDGPSPVVAQPGVSFQLKGQNLVLDCEVLEADYASSGDDTGIFQNVKVEMTVRVRD